jgi:predicted short-subunit dehydrogenase-like oxidoreductase (DUF2520 family)
VLAAGHVVALFSLAAETLARCGLSEGRAREVLLPLVQSAVENLAVSAPGRALTGSFARGDVETIRLHLRALAALDDALAARVYVALGEQSLRLAVRAGAGGDDAAGMIRRALGGGGVD